MAAQPRAGVLPRTAAYVSISRPKRGHVMRGTGIAAAAMILGCGPAAMAQPAPLPPPSFHHLMLNSVDPEAAIAFYTKAFPSTHRTTWAGYPAIQSPTNVLVLFNKVSAPPAADANATAFCHFGWNPPDQRAKVTELQNSGHTFAPLWTGLGDASVVVSSDTF